MSISANNGAFAMVVECHSRWASVVARDPQTDGQFYYSVKTTGVYCRPSCVAEHVGFMRPTKKRSRRDSVRASVAGWMDQATTVQQHATTIAQACRLIEELEEAPRLERLAQHAGLSMSHFHRLFKATTGLTPKEYAAAHQARRVRSMLDRSCTVTDAIYDAGYNSNGRFYDTSNEVLGMTPSHYRAGGPGTDIRFAVGECSLGSILVAKSDRGVCAILLGDDPDELTHDLQDRFPRANLIGGDADFEQLVSNVVGFVEAPRLGLDLPLDIRGTGFQQRVWQALLNIPTGSTTTYTDIANQIGSPKSVRAVARACGANVLAVGVPCHRVVRTDGALSGYRWGVERKRALLKREGRR